jgi:hypothetical protein
MEVVGRSPGGNESDELGHLLAAGRHIDQNAKPPPIAGPLGGLVFEPDDRLRTMPWSLPEVPQRHPFDLGSGIGAA